MTHNPAEAEDRHESDGVLHGRDDHRRVEGRDATASVMGGWDTHTGILADVLNGVRLERQSYNLF